MDENNQQIFKNIHMQADQIKKPVIEILKIYNETIAKPFSAPIYDAVQKMSKELSDTFAENLHIRQMTNNNSSISKALEALRDSYNLNLSSTAESMKDLAHALKPLYIPSNDSESDNDYVTISESSSKEFEIPDTVAIPIGNNKVKIKTELFVTLLVALITIVIEVCSFVSDRFENVHSEESQKQYEKEQLRLAREGNQILYELISSVNTSSSAQADFIEDLKEVLQENDLQSFDSEESPDSPLVSTDNNLE